MAQCSGITLAGNQCRNHGTYNGRCHHHRNQEQQAAASPSSSSISRGSSRGKCSSNSSTEDLQLRTATTNGTHRLTPQTKPNSKPTAGDVFRARGGRALMISPPLSTAAAVRGEGGGEHRLIEPEPTPRPVGGGQGHGHGQGGQVEHVTAAPPPPPPVWATKPNNSNSVAHVSAAAPAPAPAPTAAAPVPPPPSMTAGGLDASTVREALARIIDQVEDLWLEYLEALSTTAAGNNATINDGKGNGKEGKKMEMQKVMQRVLDLQRRALVRQVVDFAALMGEWVEERGKGEGKEVE
ncbi:hypothetical protein IWX49DRAFT_345375 [Phyllosticta citricarpa]|uniref:Uncharacterized protein n=2 Tax=Phyllosticta TaxID=121621 RepID=A0ABR1L9E0_9PEZI